MRCLRPRARRATSARFCGMCAPPVPSICKSKIKKAGGLDPSDRAYNGRVLITTVTVSISKIGVREETGL
jgi:hypothetical protein